MKWTLTLLFAVTLSSGFGFSPPDTTSNVIEKGTALYLISEGKRFYNEGQYRLSLVKFRDALGKDKGNAEATYWLGECHLALGNYEKAMGYVEEALIKDEEVHEEARNVLATCQHRMGLLEKAVTNYELALGVLPKNTAKLLKVEFHKAEAQRAMEMMKTPVNVKVTCLPSEINTAFEETAPVLAPDGKSFYFVSRRADNKGGGISPGDQRYFEDIYVSFWNEETKKWGKATNSADIINRVNTEGMDAISHISPDGKTMYMTINTMVMDKPKPKTRHSDIFVCRLNRRGTWNSPKAIGKPINTLLFDAAVSFTADEGTAYFVSERPGGFGRSDIWVSYKEGNGWSKPENLGDSINTDGNETTVFVSRDGEQLFFSSTGHEGMGGYDVYVATKNGDGWNAPVNLGYPINTVSDETHFVYYPELKKAFYSTFSSAENGGNGARDIFELDMSNYVWPEKE